MPTERGSSTMTPDPTLLRANGRKSPERSPKPTDDFIASWIQDQELRFRRFFQRCDRVDELYQQEHEIKIPEVYKGWTEPVRCPTVPDIIMRTKAIIGDGYPSYTVHPNTLGPAAQDRADIMEMFLNAALPQLEKQCGRQVGSNLDEYLARYGLGYLWWQYAPQSWELYDDAAAVEEPIEFYDYDRGERRRETNAERTHRLDALRKRQPLPFILVDLDPRAVLQTKDFASGMRYCAVGLYKSRLDIADRYRLSLNQEGKLQKGSLSAGTPAGSERDRTLSQFGEVKFYTFYTQDWISTYTPETGILETVPNPWPFIPVIEVPGFSTGSEKPHEAYHGIVDRILDLVPEKDRLATMWHTWAVIGSWPMGQEVLPPDALAALPTVDDLDKPVSQTKWAPGEMSRGPGRLEWVVAPDIGAALKGQLAYIDQEIERVTPVPPVLRGYPGGADESGYAVNQRRMEARSVSVSLLKNKVTGYELVAHLFLFGVEQIHFRGIPTDQMVYVEAVDTSDTRKRRDYLGIGPKIIRGHYGVSCSITSDAPYQDIALLRAGLEAWQSGAFPLEWMLEHFAKVSNPSMLVKLRMLEDYKRHPEIQKILIAQLIEEAGLLGWSKAAEQQGPPGMAPAAGEMGGPQPELVNSAFPAGPGLPAAGQQETAPPFLEATSGGGPTFVGGIPGVPITPNTQNLPGGFPVGV